MNDEQELEVITQCWSRKIGFIQSYAGCSYHTSPDTFEQTKQKVAAADSSVIPKGDPKNKSITPRLYQRVQDAEREGKVFVENLGPQKYCLWEFES